MKTFNESIFVTKLLKIFIEAYCSLFFPCRRLYFVLKHMALSCLTAQTLLTVVVAHCYSVDNNVPQLCTTKSLLKLEPLARTFQKRENMFSEAILIFCYFSLGC